jgi:PKD repeat protein
MPDLYQFTNNFNSGYTGITEFVFTPKVKKTSDIEKVLWDFGDNTISTSFEGKHTYNSPGSYQVTLNLFGKSFGFISSTKTV